MRNLIILMLISMMGFAAEAMAAGPPPGGGSANPLQERLDALTEKDRAGLPAENGVEFVGSSMFEGWTGVAAHMAPIPAFNRAIGGSKTADILAHLDQMVLQSKPGVVVLYTGINDVSEGVAPETAAGNILKIMEGIRASLPETEIIYIPMLDTANRPDVAGLITDADTRVGKYAEGNAWVTVLDIRAALVDESGNTRPEFLDGDGAHYNDAAYEAMAGVVKPAVEKIRSR